MCFEVCVFVAACMLFAECVMLMCLLLIFGCVVLCDDVCDVDVCC